MSEWAGKKDICVNSLSSLFSGDRYDPEPRSRSDFPKSSSKEYKDEFEDEERATGRPYRDEDDHITSKPYRDESP